MQLPDYTEPAPTWWPRPLKEEGEAARNNVVIGPRVQGVSRATSRSLARCGASQARMSRRGEHTLTPTSQRGERGEGNPRPRDERGGTGEGGGEMRCVVLLGQNEVA